MALIALYHHLVIDGIDSAVHHLVIDCTDIAVHHLVIDGIDSAVQNLAFVGVGVELHFFGFLLPPLILRSCLWPLVDSACICRAVKDSLGGSANQCTSNILFVARAGKRALLHADD